jgi:DNA-binding NtrC family response regulator
LKNSGFLIETLSDIQRIPDVEKYQIILCDVNNVGSALSENTQGAYVIEEIKSTYPDKVVIAYTAGSTSAKLVSRARKAADRYIKKDATIEAWRDLLDEEVKSLCNPIDVWKKTRIRLLAAGIELQDLMKLEQALLENLGKGKDSVRSAIQHEVKTADASSWKGEVSQFLVSKAFDLAFEYFVK